MPALRLLAFLFLAPALLVHAHGDGQPPWQAATAWPDRIVATLKDDPATSFAVTWRTDETVTETIAQIAPATAAARFDLGATTLEARTEPLDLAEARLGAVDYEIPWNSGLPRVHYHSVEFTGLEPDRTYVYRVRGARGAWSEWFQLRTAAADGPIRFVYFGDAQNGLRSHLPRVLRAAFAYAPDADFFLHAGDLVNRASRDLEWGEWFDAGDFIHSMIPTVPVAGNHEYAALGFGDVRSERTLSILWRPQFTLPTAPDLPEDLQEAVYVLHYSDDLDVFVLSTQHTDIASQAAWLDGELAASTARWRIVAMHHPIFSSGKDRDSPERRELLLPVFRAHSVDLVLQGHDHTYARGALGQTPERLAVGDGAGADVEMMFVNSVSGAKMYDFKADGWSDYASEGVVLQRMAENTQFFQVIEIDGDTLRYEALTALGERYDSFAMTKDEDGSKRLAAGLPSTMPERRFEGTEPYADAGELK